MSGKYVFVRKSERRINDCAFELVMPPVGGVGVLAYGHVEERTGRGVFSECGGEECRLALGGGRDFYAVGTLRKEGSWLGWLDGCLLITKGLK